MADDTRTVKCAKLGQELPGLKRPPFNNALGQRIYDEISEDAWKQWLAHSTMIINEYRVELGTPRGNELLLKECEKFFFGEGSEAPPDYKPA